jgi:hypothetical protein
MLPGEAVSTVRLTIIRINKAYHTHTHTHTHELCGGRLPICSSALPHFCVVCAAAPAAPARSPDWGVCPVQVRAAMSYSSKNLVTKLKVRLSPPLWVFSSIGERAAG